MRAVSGWSIRGSSEGTQLQGTDMGIGFDAKRAMAMQDRWGENRLGKALMAVREKLRKEVVD